MFFIFFIGYSISDGRASEQNCYEAINAAYRYATETEQIDPSCIVLFGRSLGTGKILQY